MDNIESLLQDLDAHLAEDFQPENDSLSTETATENIVGTNAANTQTQASEKDINNSPTTKKQSTKYSDFGYEIHKKLKESRRERSDFNASKSSWTTKNTENKTNTLSAPTSLITGKTDVYAEPIFGLRLVNPIVSSQFIESKMSGKQPVAVSNIAYHLKCGDKNSDWVFAGAVVFKSGLKTSQKGSQYCFWKISDLKGDLQQVTVYLFSKACSDLWKVSIGTIVAVLNAAPFHKDETTSKDDLTLTVRSADQVMIWGGSRDYGVCKAKKKNGENCTSFVNKSQCEFCIYHVKSEYNKFSSKRSDLQASFSNRNNIGLRNKILGKSEVFYGGKSYTALKIPSRSSKLEKHDSSLLNKLPLNPLKKSCSAAESDSLRLESLSSKPKLPTDNTGVSSDPDKPEPKVEKMHIVTQSIGRKSTLTGMDKPVMSRLHLLKEAGERKIQTGQTTRVTLINPEKKKNHISFATIFSFDDAQSKENDGRSLAKNKERNNLSFSASTLELLAKNGDTAHESINNSNGKQSNKTPDRRNTTPNALKTGSPSMVSSPQTTSTTANLESTKKSRHNDILLEVESPPESEKSDRWLSLRIKPPESGGTEATVSTSVSNRSLESAQKLNNLKTSALLEPLNDLANKSSLARVTNLKSLDGNNIPKNELHEPDDSKISLSKSKTSWDRSAAAFGETRREDSHLNSENLNTNSSVNGINNSKISMDMLVQSRSPLASANIRERRKAMDKMKAISLIKKKGGLSKTDPNRVRPYPEKRRSMKRPLEDEEADNVIETSALSQRFIDLMNAQSKHENLAEIAELVEQQDYFNKMEKKEQMEEKMLSTYKVPCKAVTCLKCKYKWFSASDLCRAEGHPIKVIDTVKRYFKCDNCSNRTVSLEIIPLLNCKNCGSAKWSRAPMIRERIVKSENNLCIRGDEQKFLDSLTGSVSLNLLVPEN